MIPHHFPMYYVYVIKSKQIGQHYIGLTNNIEVLIESGGG